MGKCKENMLIKSNDEMDNGDYGNKTSDNEAAHKQASSLYRLSAEMNGLSNRTEWSNYKTVAMDGLLSQHQYQQQQPVTHQQSHQSSFKIDDILSSTTSTTTNAKFGKPGKLEEKFSTSSCSSSSSSSSSASSICSVKSSYSPSPHQMMNINYQNIENLIGFNFNLLPNFTNAAASIMNANRFLANPFGGAPVDLKPITTNDPNIAGSAGVGPKSVDNIVDKPACDNDNTSDKLKLVNKFAKKIDEFNEKNLKKASTATNSSKNSKKANKSKKKNPNKESQSGCGSCAGSCNDLACSISSCLPIDQSQLPMCLRGTTEEQLHLASLFNTLMHHKKCRRTRTVFTDMQLIGLEKRFENQKYLSTPDRIQLAESLGLSQLQVKTWYQNRRMKWKKKVLKEGCHEAPTKPKGRPKKNSIPSFSEIMAAASSSNPSVNSCSGSDLSTCENKNSLLDDDSDSDVSMDDDDRDIDDDDDDDDISIGDDLNEYTDSDEEYERNHNHNNNTKPNLHQNLLNNSSVQFFKIN